MDDGLNEMARNHSAGAIIRHDSPFNGLPSHKNDFKLTQAFAEKWAKPFYMKIGSPETNWIDALKAIKSEISDDVISNLLGEYNWRPRKVGAYLSAVTGSNTFVDVIGIHLLKSELCCVGSFYALALADMNTEKSAEYLNKYLNYYLAKPDLYFDQISVMEAVIYLDKINRTNVAIQYQTAFDLMQTNRKQLAIESASASIDMLVKLDPNFNVEVYLENTRNHKSPSFADLNVAWLETQVALLQDLRQYSH